MYARDPGSDSIRIYRTPKGGEHRRIVEEPYDFSQIDFSQAEIRQALKGAYRVLLKYRAKRLSEPVQDYP
jgi:hypothetical protein